MYAFRLPFRARSITKKTRATTQRGSKERTGRDTHHGSRRQCCHMGTCCNCFGTSSVTRSSMMHMAVSVSQTYTKHNQNTSLYVFRLPLMLRCVKRKNRANTERGSEERTVRDTQHASTLQCCRIGTCSSCFGTSTLPRSPMLHMAVS